MHATETESETERRRETHTQTDRQIETDSQREIKKQRGSDEPRCLARTSTACVISWRRASSTAAAEPLTFPHGSGNGEAADAFRRSAQRVMRGGGAA